MLLRRISIHIKNQNWFAVFIDFLIVVVGILIAFQITSWHESREEKANLVNAEEALKWDLFTNYYNSQERLVLVDCRKASIQALGEKLLEPNFQWQGFENQVVDLDQRMAFKNVLTSPSRNWGSRIWDAELARGTFNVMDTARRQSFDIVFTQAKNLEKLQEEILELQAGLGVLSHTIDLPYSDRLRYFDQLSLIDQKSVGLELGAKQIAERIVDLGIDISKETRENLRVEFAKINKTAGAKYGACRKPLVIPFILEPGSEAQ